MCNNNTPEAGKKNLHGTELYLIALGSKPLRGAGLFSTSSHECDFCLKKKKTLIDCSLIQRHIILVNFISLQ